MASEIARIFNSTIAASALAALDEIGLIDALARADSLGIEEFCQRHDLHRPSIEALTRTLAGFGVLELAAPGTVLRKGPQFEEALKEKGYFLWLVRGYGRMLEGMGSMVKNPLRTGNFMGRNGEYIARAGRDYGARFVDQHFFPFLAERPFRTAADLGCGSAFRLIRLARERPEFRGIGIEFDPNAVAFAREAATAAGVADRIDVLQADVKKLVPRPGYETIETVFCFFMAHDLYPREDCIRTLNSIRQAFPRAERFLLSDTYRSDLPAAPDWPTFTLGFEVTHAVMGQYLPSRGEWLELFAESEWECAGEKELGIPFSCVFDLRPRHAT